MSSLPVSSDEIRRLLLLPDDNDDVDVSSLVEDHHRIVAASVLSEVDLNVNQDRSDINKIVVSNKKQGTERYRNKRAREEGRDYVGREKCENGKCKKVKKSEKVLGPACSSPVCAKSVTKRLCKTFNEDNRKKIFEEFWSLPYNSRPSVVRSLVDIVPTSRRTKFDPFNKPTRESEVKYYLKEDNVRIQVCKTTFLNTLALKSTTLRTWIHAATAPAERKPKKQHDNHQFHLRLDNLMSFLDKLAKVPSHYCRRSSNKIYIERPITTKNELYRIYQTAAKEDGLQPVSWGVFYKTLKDQRISVFKPRKDQCDNCVGYKINPDAHPDFKTHWDLKEQAQKSKSFDKKSSDPDTCVLCVDVQATLLCPVKEASALYYKKKLSVHNYTVFDLKCKDVDCYVWHEAEGGLDSNVFASVLCRTLELKKQKNPNIKHFIIYSDGCGYQNRCTVISNALLLFAIQNNVVIEQKYLEKGHTQMEVDSVHATIERYIKNKEIEEPEDYVKLIEKSRINGSPYVVHYLKYNFFKDYSKVNFCKKIRPGNKVGEPLVHAIRCLKYLPSHEIFYKLLYSDDYTKLPQTINKKASTTVVSAYSGRQPIKSDKYNDLQYLKEKTVIAERSWSFYDELPHQ